MIKNLKSIEEMLKLEAGTLQKAIENNEEVEVTLPELIVRTKEENDYFLNNIENDKKERYEAGKEKGIKDDINANIELFGINLEGKAKTFENFATALKEKLSKDLGKPKDDELESLRSDNEKLKSNYSELETEFNTFKTNTETQNKKNQLNDIINKSIPSEGLTIPRDDVALIFRSKFEGDFDGDKTVWKKDGQIMKNDKTLNPLSIEDIMPSFISAYTKTQEVGSGKGDEGGSKTESSYDKFEKEMVDKGINPGSEKFNIEMQSRQKEGTLTI